MLGGMEAAEITPGMAVIITDSLGTEIKTTALSGVETEGHSFPVVWVERPLTDGSTDRVPWPFEAVRLA
jgi:hypothetical protein